jgi:imidazolonepropionase-like amidohydrolase
MAHVTPALHLRAVCLPDEVERDLYVVGDRLSFEPVAGAQTIADRGWAVPGLVDAHCHIGLADAAPVTEVDVARRLAHTDRDVGVLTIRDAGSPLAYAELDDEPGMPRLFRAGRHIAPPKRYLRGYAIETVAADLPVVAAEQAKIGNGWVKLVGDWIDRETGDLAPTYDPDSLADAVRAAHEGGARVTVHTFSESALPLLLDAGLDCIEHGTGLSTDLIDTMARRGTALVPTMVNIETFDDIADRAGKFPVYADHMRALKRRFPSVVMAAYEAGVPIYVGTDAGGVLPHGLAIDEMERMHAVGMSTVDVLAAGSWKAREWLGLPGIEQGAPADLVVYDRDPRRDLGVLRQPLRIVLRGCVIR